MEKLHTTKQISELTELSEAWFEKARYLGSGHGPPYIKLPNGAVRYRLSEVDAWFEKHRISEAV